MARILGAFPAALRAAQAGLSANAFAKALAESGYGARRSEVLQLYKIARDVVTRAPDEPFRPQGSVPRANEIGEWPVKSRTGFAQTVTITYRDRTTGGIKQTWYRRISDTPITRERVVAEAIDAYSEHAESYEQDLIGAVHTSTYSLTPMGF